MLTRAGFGLLTAALLLVVVAVPTGNLFLLTLAILPLAFFLLAAEPRRQVHVDARLHVPDRALRVGETVTFTLEYRVRGAPGLVELHQPLPGLFVLTEGNNLHLLPKGSAPARGRISFTVRCTRRGRFTVPPATWEHIPSLGLGQGRSGTAGEPLDLTVRPAVTSFRRMLRVRSRANRAFPENDTARLGVQTTEFRDIRAYVRGDPPKTINWKATARLQSRLGRTPRGASGHAPPSRHVTPLVNEYEYEGKKSVWILLDCAPYMRVGTSAENVFEVAVAAATGTAQYFTERGYRVGFTLFNRAEPRHLYPDTGTRQLMRIQEALAEAEPTTTRGELPRAVEDIRPFLLMARGLVVVITRAELADGTMHAGIRRLRRLVAPRRGRAPVIIASPSSLSLLPDLHAGTDVARRIEEARDRERLRTVRRLGVLLLHWDPRRTRFEQLLASKVGIR